MAATTTFEIGAGVNTASNYTDVTMAYLQDEVMFDFIFGFDGEKSLHLILSVCSCISLTEVFTLKDAQNVISSKLAEMALPLAF